MQMLKDSKLELGKDYNYKDIDKIFAGFYNELDSISNLRLEVDEGLEKAMLELEGLSKKVSQNQAENLFEQCTKNAMDAVIGHFGLVAVVLDSKDGGNVTTTRNFKQGYTANETDRAKYNAYKEGYERTQDYDKIKDNIRDSSPLL